MTTLGKYELIYRLGEGATSEVYRARDTALGREVALKVLKPSLVADASAFERFSREAQAAAGLFHPNIATVLDMGEADGRYFIAMRYFEGKALDKVLREDGPLTWDKTLRLLAQIGSALDHAHKKGFLHRDVKPGNIIRDENGDFILTDFGLTRAMMSTGLTSHTGAVLGTPAYIAPEVWNGEDATPATDQYALACVLYECLTGKLLFDGDTPLALMKKVFDGPHLSTVWPQGVPARIVAVLERALATRPDDRHLSLAAFEQACQELNEKHAAPPREEKAQPASTPVIEPVVKQAVPRFTELADRLESIRQAEAVLASARAAVVQGKYAEALSLAAQCAAMEPENTVYSRTMEDMREKLRQMARAFEAKGKWDQAIKIWRALKQISSHTSLSPESTGAMLAPGAMIESDGQPPRSFDILEKARQATQAGNVEQAVQWLKNADRKDNSTMLTVNELIKEIRIQIQHAEKNNQWERAKQLWALIKQLQSQTETR